MRQKPDTLRIAAAALFASVALPSTSLAQQAPVVVTPPPAATAPAPAPNPIVVTPRPSPLTPSPVTTTPSIATTPPVVRSAPAPQPTIRTPAPAARAPATTTRTPARVERPAQRPAPRARTAAPAERAAPAPAPVPEAATPATPPAEALPPAPVATTPIPVESTTPVTTPPANPTATGALWAMIAAGAVLLAFLAFFLFRRRRRDEDVYEPASEEAPAAAGAGVAAPREGDIEALLETSKPPVGRPWLELLLRPVRAGTTPDEARVDFELTVGNTGSVPARDVTVSTWMLAEGATEMERSLISPPAEAHRSHLDIPAHEGARLDTTVALPTDGLDGAVLPVVAAEVRYRLPDGREGRTAASFAIGRADGEALAPFAVDRPSGLREDIEARLHGRPEQV